MPNRLDPELAVLYFVERIEDSIEVTKLMKLLFLADVEHQQLYGEPLTDIPWSYLHHGAFSQVVYKASAALTSAGLVEVTMQQWSGETRTLFRKAHGAGSQIQGRLSNLGQRPLRAMAQVVERYGHMPVWQIKRASYETMTMADAVRNDRLDLAREPRHGGTSQVPGIAAFMATAPAIVQRDVGNSGQSEQEDMQILEELGSLRRTANLRDL